MYPDCISVIGNGCVVNPAVLLEEIDMFERDGISTANLKVSGNAHVIMPYHMDLDGAYEELLGKNNIGTTKRGIGPCYQDKMARVGIRMQDLLDEGTFRAKLQIVLDRVNPQLELIFKLPTYSVDQICEDVYKRQDLGFASSWRMLTRDKGWIKPVLILTMVGWIPILGQIVLFGYGLEWARLTAWGVDSAPKQRGVDYGKVLESGGRAFLVTVTLGFVVALVLQVVFPGSLGLLISGFAGNGLLSSSATFSTGLAMSLLALAASLLMGSFLQAAALRATIYDSFSAGWLMCIRDRSRTITLPLGTVTI